MSDTTTLEVRQIVADVLGLELEQVGPLATAEEIEQWDSLRHLDVIMTLEQRFGLRLGPEQMAELGSIPAVVAVVEQVRGG